jgi:hypothetical protein
MPFSNHHVAVLESHLKFMDEENRKHWNDLCEQATKETDPKRLAQQIAELVSLLRSRQEQLAEDKAASPTPAK